MDHVRGSSVLNKSRGCDCIIRINHYPMKMGKSKRVLTRSVSMEFNFRVNDVFVQELYIIFMVDSRRSLLPNMLRSLIAHSFLSKVQWKILL